MLKREYIERITAKIDNIVHRGRKRRCGVILATQSPTDVNPIVSALCNTKVTFRLSGVDQWINRNFGKTFKEKVKRLDTGTCLINMAGTGSKIPPIMLTIPNVNYA